MSGQQSATNIMAEKEAIHEKEAINEKEENVLADDDYVPGTHEEKLLVRKIDRQLMPCIWLMYIFNYLDRVRGIPP